MIVLNSKNAEIKIGGAEVKVDWKTLELADGILYVKTADAAEKDDARPITSGAVFEIIGAVRPDWSANDEDNSAYIKNRTHWAETKPATTEYFAAEVTTAQKEGFAIAVVQKQQEPLDEVITAGKEYFVAFNGEVYRLAGHTRESGGDSVTDVGWLGNLVLFDANATDTGEPFYIQTPSKNLVQVRTFEAGAYSFNITRIDGTEKIYHPLEEGYIPESIARKSDITSTVGDIETLLKTI